ncbi:hypothetical protein GPALN_012414 [Globodera pallida]|nr:hypothetical protein GPALN_012414 [Globodera pallida]
MNLPTIAIILSLFFCVTWAGICTSRPRARSCPLPRQKSNSTAFHDGSIIEDAIAYCKTNRPSPRGVVEPKISLAKLRTLSANRAAKPCDEAGSGSGGKKSRDKTENKRCKIYIKGP